MDRALMFLSGVNVGHGRVHVGIDWGTWFSYSHVCEHTRARARAHTHTHSACPPQHRGLHQHEQGGGPLPSHGLPERGEGMHTHWLCVGVRLRVCICVWVCAFAHVHLGRFLTPNPNTCLQLFSHFDSLVVAHGVHKVETAGE